MEKNSLPPQETSDVSRKSDSAVWGFVRRQWKRLVAFLGLVGLVVGLVIGFWEVKEILERRSDNNERIERESRRIRVLVPLYGTKKEFFTFIDLEEGKQRKLGKDSFSRKVSRDMITGVQGAAQKWFSLRRGQGDRLSDKQVDFYFFPEGYAEDRNSYRTALAKAQREAAADGYDVAGLVGNVTSTATVEYGKLCGQKRWEITKHGSDATQHDEGQIPMLLPLSTASNLPQTLRASDVPAVLRLPPDNEKQATVLADFLLRKSNPAVTKSVVITDVSNITYSNDLIENFRDKYVQLPLKEAQEITAKFPKDNQKDVTEFITWGNILAVLPAGGESGDPAMFPIIEKLAPDAVLVCGMTNVSLETLAQVYSSNVKPKYLLLTDGAVDEYLLPQIATFTSVSQRPEVLLSFPLEIANPPTVEETLKSNTPEKDRRNLEMTHASYVIDSVYIILTLLDEGIYQRKLKGTGRGILSQQMRSLYESGPKDIGISVPSGLTYTFDTFGNSTNLEYRMFRMCLPQLKGCPTDRGMIWEREDKPTATASPSQESKQ